MKNIVLIGQLTDISGYGNASRAYCKTLIELHNKKLINLKLIDHSFERTSVPLSDDLKELLVEEKEFKNLLEEDYELIFFLTNDSMLIGKEEKSIFLSNPNGKKYINTFSLCQKAKKIFPCVVWETDKVPSTFLDSYSFFKNKIDTLLCACEWNNETFSVQTGLNTITIPYTEEVDHSIDEEFFKKIDKHKNDRFTFVSLSQWSYRKGFDKLIKAFLLEFKNEPVNLILKTYANRAFFDKDETAAISRVVEMEKSKLSFEGKRYNGECSIIVINSILSKRQINSVYKTSQCMVSCTRGEGFGLPIAEFLSFEKPVIIPDKGGHLDFCSQDNFFIESRYEPFENCPNHFYSSEMNCVEVSLSSTMKKMREAYELHKSNKTAFYEKGLSASKYSKKYLSLDRNIQLFKTALGIL